MDKKKKAGVIFILTNPSFPDYVKIGYATDIEKRHSIAASVFPTPFGYMQPMKYPSHCKTSSFIA